MNYIILMAGVICLVAGLAPLPVSQSKKVELRIHQVQHERCVVVECVVVDKEM